MISQAPSATPADTRICMTCLEARPTTEFRLRYAGTQRQHTQCRWCHNAIENNRNQRRKDKRFRTLAQDINRARTPAEIVACFGPLLVQDLGGVASFLVAWNEHIQKAMQDRPGHRDVLNSFRAIMRLMELASTRQAQNQQYRDTKEMSLEELEAELTRHFHKVLGDQLKITVEELRQCGWTVIEPAQKC